MPKLASRVARDKTGAALGSQQERFLLCWNEQWSIRLIARQRRAAGSTLSSPQMYLYPQTVCVPWSSSLCLWGGHILYSSSAWDRFRRRNPQTHRASCLKPDESVVGFPGGSVVKNPPASSGDVRGPGLIPVSGRSSGEGNGNPLQYSCLENSMDRGAWRATVQGVAKS